MTNPLKLIQDLDTPCDRTPAQPTKSRRQRRQEGRDSEASKERSADRIKSAQVNSQRKVG